MALRLFLVSMVAGMGLSLPTARDIEEWNHKARALWVAGLEQWDAMMPTGVRVFAEDPRPAPTVIVAEPEAQREVVAPAFPTAEDIQFEAIVEVMASRFSAELEPPIVAQLEAVTAAVARVTEAAPLPEEAGGEDLPADVFAEDVSREAAGDGFVEPIPTASATPTVDPQGVVRALQLTREAANAWVSLLGGRTTVASARH